MDFLQRRYNTPSDLAALGHLPLRGRQGGKQRKTGGSDEPPVGIHYILFAFCCSSQISSTAMSAGLTPEIRPA